MLKLSSSTIVGYSPRVHSGSHGFHCGDAGGQDCGDLGPKIYVVGGAVILVGALIPLMLVVMIKRMKKVE